MPGSKIRVASYAHMMKNYLLGLNPILMKDITFRTLNTCDDDITSCFFCFFLVLVICMVFYVKKIGKMALLSVPPKSKDIKTRS